MSLSAPPPGSPSDGEARVDPPIDGPAGDKPPAGPPPKRPAEARPLRLPFDLSKVKTPDWLTRLMADPMGRIVVAVAGVGVCGLGLLVCINLSLLLPGSLGSPFPFGASTTPPLPTAEVVSSDTLVSSSSVQVPLSLPQTLKFGGLSLPVASVSVGEDGAWPAPSGRAAIANWVYGSLVNYVFGVPDTAANLEAIDSLAKGDTIELQMSDTRALRFQVSEKLSVPVSQTDIFSQTEPRLTLVLVGGRGETRLAIQALFVGQSGGEAGPGVSETYDLGVPAQAGDLLVTVTATRLVTFGASELPAGLAYYLVDFVVENTGPGPIEASLVVTELVDSTGARYAPVIPVSAVTTSPPLTGRINPNDVINASAAYLVSANFSDVGTMWQFRPSVGSREAIQVNLATALTAGPNVNVTLKSATLGADRTELMLTGTVVNLADAAINVSEADLALVSGAGQMGTLVHVEPPLPWTLEPAAFLSYEISFARPTTSSVIFRLLGWEFELTGVQ